MRPHVPGWGFRHPDVPLRPSMVLATLGVTHEMSGTISMVEPDYTMLMKPQQGSVRILVYSNITLNNGYVHDTTLRPGAGIPNRGHEDSTTFLSRWVYLLSPLCILPRKL